MVANPAGGPTGSSSKSGGNGYQKDETASALDLRAVSWNRYWATHRSQYPSATVQKQLESAKTLFQSPTSFGRNDSGQRSPLSQ